MRSEFSIGPIVAAVGVLVDRQHGKVLLGKRAAGMSFGGTWCNPGGKIEPTDGSPLEACFREVREEMNATPPSTPFATMIHTIGGGDPFEGGLCAAFFFNFVVGQDADYLRPKPGEFDELRWWGFWNGHGVLHPGTSLQLAFLRAFLYLNRD